MSGLTETWTTSQEQDRGMLCFFGCLLHRKNQSPVTSIVLDLAATLFTPDLQKSFVDSNTSPHLHQSSDEGIFIFQ